ncbi:MAG TPA: ABC transporter ATP-binding protein [Bacteroidales bacterium]|nr:ABC transporter ATP-binding protein [Bacteroidales bacterium]HPI85733.1 ABC transporter ATP-binding protein [Bacteroidales bacterium]
MIGVSNLSKVYSGVTVLNIDSLEIKAGESFGLVGNNGAGKTTLFRLILDLIRPQTGFVTSKEQDVSRSENWKLYTGSYLDRNFLIDFLTPEEYFDFNARIHGMSPEDLQGFLESMTEFFNDEILGKKKFIRDLSKGNQQKIGVAAAFMADPEVIILDEPFNGLDPSSQIRLINMLNRLKENKRTTLLISSHDLNHVTEVCSRIAILEKGIIVKDLQTEENTLKELRNYFSV